MSTSRGVAKLEAEYFSKDFDWEDVKHDVENDPSFHPHLLPFQPSCSSTSPDLDSRAWAHFHSRHCTGKFFKERRYLLVEFPELVSCSKNSRVLEVGCGNGSTVLPILRGNEDVTVYACDCSEEALVYAKEIIDASNVASVEHRFHPFHCDFSLVGFPTWLACGPCREMSLPEHCCSSGSIENNRVPSSDFCLSQGTCCLGGVNFVTLIFTLSAIAFQRMPKALRECFSVLKPGGLLLFRDYGLYDMTMLRFELGKRVGFREYMRSDGTRSYFFSL